MKSTALCAVLLAAVACGDDPDLDHDHGDPPASYGWDSRFVDGESAVSYSGQTLRHSLIAELTGYIGRLTATVDASPPADGEIESALLFYFDFDSSTGGATALSAMTAVQPLLQQQFDDISSGKDLRGKLAGNDAATDHKAWNTPGNFLGWSTGGEAADTPTELVEHWFAQLDDLAYARGQGDVPLDPDGAPIAEVYVTADGHDLKQLIQKFLLGAVTLQQGLDDYLDDDTDGKGLLASNLPEDGAAYSALEHAWDEGFGYFGAARDFADYTDDEIAGKGGRPGYQGSHDTNGDDMIDLRAEMNFGNAVNCAKRDRGASAEAPTDFTGEAFDAFLAGRHLIYSTDGELSADQLAELRGYRDAISAAWEACVAATVIHYINELQADLDAIGTDDYDFLDQAKHFSELKGFALGLQFNPRSPLHEGTRFADLHVLIGDAPVLPGGGSEAITAYRADLDAARDLMAEAYGFAEVNASGW